MSAINIKYKGQIIATIDTSSSITKTLLTAGKYCEDDIEIEYTTYNSLIPSATDTDGSIYNGTGYKSGYRLSSSGIEQEYAGFCLSGFIPVTFGDTVYLKNVNYNSANSGSSQRICFYDSNKNFITGCISGANSTAQLGKVYDSNNNLTQFQIMNVGSNSAANAKYFRIAGLYIGADSIITVNEQII